MCFSADTCRGHEDGAFSAPPCNFPLPSPIIDDRCQIKGWMLKGRKCWQEVVFTGQRRCVHLDFPWNGELRLTLHFSGRLLNIRKRTNAVLSVCLCPSLLCLCLSPSGSVSLSVFLVSVAFVVCAVWLVALCGVCTWCQRKLVSYGLAFHFSWYRLWNAILTVNQSTCWIYGEFVFILMCPFLRWVKRRWLFFMTLHRN